MGKISTGPLVLEAAAKLRAGALVEGCEAVLGIPLRISRASG